MDVNKIINVVIGDKAFISYIKFFGAILFLVGFFNMFLWVLSALCFAACSFKK